MELVHHTKHTEAALRLHEAKTGAPIASGIRSEILIGAHANDLCEFTNESKFEFHREKSARSLWDMFRKPANTALYQSHEGTLATLHCMSKNAGEPAQNTKIDLDAWFPFLNDLALGRFADPRMLLAELPSKYRLGYLFDGTPIRLIDLVDSDDAGVLPHRALGMMLHIMEDSCTSSHCERDLSRPGYPIRQFFHYGSQSQLKHKKGDSQLNVEESFLHENLRECVACILSGTDYHWSKFIAIDHDAFESSGGPWKRNGWLDR